MVGNLETIGAPFQRVKAYFDQIPQIPVEILTIAWVLLVWWLGNLLFESSESMDLVILGIAAVPMLFIFWFRPEYGLIALMFFSSGFLAPNFVDIRLPIGGGLEMPEMLLFSLFGTLFVQRLIRKQLTIPWWPIGGFLLIFLGFAVFSAFNALAFENVPSNWALSDLRILFFYLTFFIAAWAIQSERSLYTVIFGAFVIADITAGIIIIQQFLGANNLLLESMTDGSWAVYNEGGFVRILPPGIVFLYLMFLISFGYMVFAKKSASMLLFAIAQCGFLGLALLFTFTRSAWAATGIALILVLLILLPYYRSYYKHFLFFGAAGALFLFGGLGLVLDNRSVDIPLVESFVERFTSIFTVGETFESNSLIWRRFEFEQGVKSIRENPLVGVGLGNTYRSLTTLQGEAQGSWVDGDLSARRIDRFARYSHSSYLAIMIKMGIPALFFLLWFCFGVITHGIAMYYELEPGLAKGLALVIGPALLGLMQWSIFHAQLFLLGSTPVVGLMAGILAAICAMHLRRKGELPASNRVKIS